jgi:hypothetical protein
MQSMSRSIENILCILNAVVLHIAVTRQLERDYAWTSMWYG